MQNRQFLFIWLSTFINTNYGYETWHWDDHFEWNHWQKRKCGTLLATFWCTNSRFFNKGVSSFKILGFISDPKVSLVYIRSQGVLSLNQFSRCPQCKSVLRCPQFISDPKESSIRWIHILEFSFSEKYILLILKEKKMGRIVNPHEFHQ